MILYSTGADHAAAAKATNLFCRADEDPIYWTLKGRPHPENLKVSYGPILADLLKMTFHNGAEAEFDNLRIIENMMKWIDESRYKPGEIFILTQWTDFGVDDYEHIYGLHLTLKYRKIKHLFFNGSQSFVDIPEIDRYTFSDNYIHPHLPEESFDGYLRAMGFDSVISSNKHFGPQAHSAWARRLLQFIVQRELLT